jgi:hypothetical protein
MQGKFEVIESFAIRSRGEFYLLGRLLEGEVQPDWFVSISLNSTLAMTVRISEVEREVEISNDEAKYMLLILKDEEGEPKDSLFIDLLLGMKVGAEILNIVAEGDD